MIDCTNPKAEIRWAMAGSSGRQVFVISVEEFLLFAASANSEAEFRSALYVAGRVEDNRRKPRALTAPAGVSR